ncbi:MAG: hypothetical protein ACN4ES_08750 [Cellulophaga baltica]
MNTYLNCIENYTPTGADSYMDHSISKPIAMASKEHDWAFATPVAIIASKLIVIHLQLN